MKIFITSCITALIVVYGQVGICEKNQDLLGSFGILSIKGIAKEVMHPSPLSDKELNARADRLRRRMMGASHVETMSPPEIELLKRSVDKSVEQSKKYKIEGQQGVNHFQVILGSNGMLGIFDQVLEGDDWASNEEFARERVFREWVLVQPGMILTYREQQAFVQVSSGKLTVSNQLGKLIHMLGGLGQVEKLAEITVAKKFFLQKGEKLNIFRAAALSAKFRKNSDVLEEAIIEHKKMEQKTIFQYKNFQKIGNEMVPLLVETAIKNENFSADYSVKIDSWKLVGNDELKKVQLPSFGHVTVHDARVSPPLQYPAYGKILSEKQLVDFVADPTLLKAYIKEVEQRSAER